MNTTRLSLLTIAAALALAGCGNKGPLVLPDTPEEEAPAAVDETDTAADETTDGAVIDDATSDDSATDAGTAEDADSVAEPVDDADTPAESGPLPQDDGAGG